MVRRVHTAGGYRQHLGPRGRHRRRKADTCRSAVIALFGRTPREGTAGHVATRRGLDPAMRPGGRRADPLGTAGSRAVARWLSRPGPRRDATRRAHGPNTHAMPGAVPAPAEGAPRRNRACGRCRERHAAAAALDGSAKSVEGITQAGCGFAGPGRDGGSPITTQLPHARPANAGRGRPLPRAGGGPQESTADVRRAARRLDYSRESRKTERAVGRRCGGRVRARLTGRTPQFRPGRAWRTGR